MTDTDSETRFFDHVATLRRDNSRLRALLRQSCGYARHREDCATWSPVAVGNDAGVCDCGLDGFLAAVPPPGSAP